VSSVDTRNFKAASSLEIPFTSREPEIFTTTVLNHSSILEFGAIFKGARIVNNDSIASLNVRLHSNRGVIRTIPPSSELTIQEWFSDIFLTPDAVTGSGQIELDVVELDDARRSIGK